MAEERANPLAGLWTQAEQLLAAEEQRERAAGQLHWAIRLRRRLLLPWASRWNALVRDATAELERRLPRRPA